MFSAYSTDRHNQIALMDYKARTFTATQMKDWHSKRNGPSPQLVLSKKLPLQCQKFCYQSLVLTHCLQFTQTKEIDHI